MTTQKIDDALANTVPTPDTTSVAPFYSRPVSTGPDDRKYWLTPPLGRSLSSVSLNELARSTGDYFILPRLPEVGKLPRFEWTCYITDTPNFLIPTRLVSEHEWESNIEEENKRPKLTYLVEFERMRQVPGWDDEYVVTTGTGTYNGRASDLEKWPKHRRDRLQRYIERVTKKRARRAVEVYDTTKVYVLLPPYLWGMVQDMMRMQAEGNAHAIKFSKATWKRHVPYSNREAFRLLKMWW